MASEYKSKHGIVSKSPYELFMAFSDMSNFKRMLPPDKQDSVIADYDTLTATYNGMSMGVKVYQRVPYSRIELVDYGAPFGFYARFHFDPVSDRPGATDFYIELSADLNMVTKMFIGGKIQGVLDKIVDGLADASEGKMPEGFDPSQFGL